jgi:hypothetical protein
MNTCFNHPDKKALSICHGCGKKYCELCLDEGKEYYYCKNPECHKLLEKELPHYNAPENAVCPKCEYELELSEDERIIGKTHCPECNTVVDCTVNPTKVLEKEDYTEIISSLNQGDIALIKSILDNGDIDYQIFGENFLSVRPLLEPARIFVNTNQIEKVQELLKGFDLKIFGVSAKRNE